MPFYPGVPQGEISIDLTFARRRSTLPRTAREAN
jgi:hypothetical protein